jgi:hypothetical protein
MSVQRNSSRGRYTESADRETGIPISRACCIPTIHFNVVNVFHSEQVLHAVAWKCLMSDERGACTEDTHRLGSELSAGIARRAIHIYMINL